MTHEHPTYLIAHRHRAAVMATPYLDEAATAGTMSDMTDPSSSSAGEVELVPAEPAFDLAAVLPVEVQRAAADLTPFLPNSGADEISSVDPALLNRLRQLLEASKAENTKRAYASDWRRFAQWCAAQHRGALPAEPLTLALYLADASTIRHEDGRPVYTAATLARWASAISAIHRDAGLRSPARDDLVRTTLAGIRRTLGVATTQKRALLLTDIRAMLAHLPPIGWPTGAARRRDHAVLLVGWAGAFRRSELAALDVDDVVLHSEDGLHLDLRKSKTDQEAAGDIKAIPYGTSPQTCAPCAIVAWREVLDTYDTYDTNDNAGVRQLLEHERPQRGHICRRHLLGTSLPGDRPLWRPISRHGHLRSARLTDGGIKDIVKRLAAAAGIHPDLVAGHSLRAGFVTQAARSGAPVNAIMRQTGHRSPTMVYRYIRPAAPLADNAVTQVGL